MTGNLGVRAGRRVVLNLLAAGRDPARFDRPDAGARPAGRRCRRRRRPRRRLHAAHQGRLRPQNALGAVLEPTDIAEAAVFLCQETSRHITGQTIHVNGGAFM
ncbi:SDR family oxidoreductase [Streptomyces sp. NPDC056161]|uniref:SDR family oxidoreductase n=1 Tax=Streptomyces sp. NPDC056161 TaxID=3345732 RepID=UPI0035DE7813